MFDDVVASSVTYLSVLSELALLMLRGKPLQPSRICWYTGSSPFKGFVRFLLRFGATGGARVVRVAVF